MSNRIERLDRSGTLDRAVFAFVLIAIPLLVATTSRIFGDGDVSWHIAAGRWILSHRAVPTTDPFSFTWLGRPWVAFEWLSEVFYAAMFALGNYAGLAVAVAGLIVLLDVLILAYVRRFIGPLRQLIVILAVDCTLLTFLLARPHVIGWVLLALWTVAILHARERGRAPSLWLTPLVAVWANFHASWAIGILVAAALGLEAMLECRWNRRQFLSWLLFGLVSLAMALLTPNWLRGFLHPFNVSKLTTLSLISEWKPSSVAQTPTFFVAAFGLIAALLIRGTRVPPIRAAMLLGLVVMALWQVRHQAPAVIIGSLLAAPLIRNRDTAPRLFDTRREGWAVGTAAVVLLAGAAAVRLAIPFVPPDSETAPRGLLAAIPPSLAHRPVLNGYSLGGPLILAGIRPFIDGRSDMYGDRFMTEYVAMIHGDLGQFERAVRRYDIAWTILPDSSEGLVAELDHLPGWKRIYADKVGVIHVRTGPRDQPMRLTAAATASESLPARPEAR